MIYSIVFVVFLVCLFTCACKILEGGIEGKRTFINAFFLGSFCLLVLIVMLPVAWERMP